MNKILTTLIVVFAGVLFADDTVLVNNTGELTYPLKAEFYNKNIRVFRQNVRLFVDTIPSVSNEYMQVSTYSRSNPFYYQGTDGLNRTVSSGGKTMATFSDYYRSHDVRWWTDCEVKVIDKFGNLVYFTSSIMLGDKQVQQLHPSLCDLNPKIYVWSTDTTSQGCWGAKVVHTDFESSIGEKIGTVTGIWIEPDYSSTEKRDNVPKFEGAGIYKTQSVVWGEYVQKVFANPDNTVLVWRQTIDVGETYNGQKLWRPARLEFFGEIKELK